jgi:dihydroorotate dehydrogenase electron transfer subunit
LKQIVATVLSNMELLDYPGARYFLMRMKAPEIAAESKPGQFVMVKCGNDTVLRRPLSVHSVDKRGDIELLYAVADVRTDYSSQTETQGKAGTGSTRGKGTLWLSELKEGAQLDLIGPLGNGFSVEPSSNNLLLTAGGIGLAPLRFLAEDALSRGKSVTMLLGARTAGALFPGSLLPQSMNLVCATEDGTAGKHSMVVDMVPEYLAWADQLFACGPKAMYVALEQQMQSWPVGKPVQVSLELRMGCGTGICYSCGFRTEQGMKRICKEGPVFNIKDIIWQEVRT